jgi:hypothetical protein
VCVVVILLLPLTPFPMPAPVPQRWTISSFGAPFAYPTPTPHRPGSPYAEPFRSRLDLHLKFLGFMSDLLMTWVAVQASWHFLGGYQLWPMCGWAGLGCTNWSTVVLCVDCVRVCECGLLLLSLFSPPPPPERIFTSADLKQQMPVEAAKFDAVDAVWRSIVSTAVSDPRCTSVANIPGMHLLCRVSLGPRVA